MASSFQPADPHPDTQGTATGKTSVVVTAVVSALLAVMLVTVMAPRAFGEYQWLATIGIGVLVLIVVLAVGLFWRAS